jgi:hypothetical protein
MNRFIDVVKCTRRVIKENDNTMTEKNGLRFVERKEEGREHK